MPAPEVEEFAALLIAHVRDMAVSSCDLLRDPKCNAIDAKRWRQRLEAGNVEELLAEMIPDCVDDTLFYLLNAVDQGLLQISFKSSSGKTIDLAEAGESEMSGRYMATGGWRSRFSKERFNDDFTDLA